MTNTYSLTGLQAGLAALTLATGLGACGVAMPRRDGGDASRDATADVRDARSDVFRDTRTDAGRCPAVSFNPPHAIRFRGYDVRYGGSGTPVAQTTLPFGGAYVGARLVLPGSFTGGDASTMTFVGLLQLGSMPVELPSTDERVRRRVNGDPLSALVRPGFMNWDEAFPGSQSIGLAYTVEGRIDPAACLLSLRVIGAVNTPDGFRTNQPLLALPFYGPRMDGRYEMAAADFGNEALAVFTGALTLNFPLNSIPQAGQAGESAVITVCEDDCPTVVGGSLRRLEAVLVGRLPAGSPAPSGADAGADARTDAAIDAAADARPDVVPPMMDAERDATRDATGDARTDTAIDARTDAATDTRDASTDARDATADTRG